MNLIPNRETKVIDLGLIDYQQAWDYQTSLFDSILEVKTNNRLLPKQKPTQNFLVFCEHTPVFTLGKSGDENNILINKEELASLKATYVHTNRGGDITYHGPGQIVVYPVLDLENFFTDIHRYMRTLEEGVIQTLRDFSVEAGRIPGLTGVWIEAENSKARKICALGVKTSRWVTMHGLALNVNTDIQYFDFIVPCGISGKAVTSLERELGQSQNLISVKKTLQNKLVTLFDMLISEKE